MEIKLVNRGDEGELLLIGRLDANTARDVEPIFTQMAERFQTVTLNLAKMEYVSSAGLRILKRLHIAMRKKEGNLFLKNTDPHVMEVFEMTGFAGLLQFK